MLIATVAVAHAGLRIILRSTVLHRALVLRIEDLLGALHHAPPQITLPTTLAGVVPDS